MTLPRSLSLVFALLLGAVQVLNQVVFKLGEPYSTYLTLALLAAAYYHIEPLRGAAFASALHLKPALSGLIGAALGVLTVAVSTLHAASGVHAAIVAVITVAAALGFNAAPIPATTPPKP